MGDGQPDPTPSENTCSSILHLGPSKEFPLQLVARPQVMPCPLAAHEATLMKLPATSFSTTHSDSQTSLPVWLRQSPDVAKLRRRQLRCLDRSWSEGEVAQHHYVDDAWIVVDGRVYDITEHLLHHPGWGNAGVSTPLSILAHAGRECSAEFHDIHRPYPLAYKQLPAFYIGPLQQQQQQAGQGVLQARLELGQGLAGRQGHAARQHSTHPAGGTRATQPSPAQHSPAQPSPGREGLPRWVSVSVQVRGAGAEETWPLAPGVSSQEAQTGQLIL